MLARCPTTPLEVPQSFFPRGPRTSFARFCVPSCSLVQHIGRPIFRSTVSGVSTNKPLENSPSERHVFTVEQLVRPAGRLLRLEQSLERKEISPPGFVGTRFGVTRDDKEDRKKTCKTTFLH